MPSRKDVRFAPLPIAHEVESTSPADRCMARLIQLISVVPEVVRAGASWGLCSIGMTLLNKRAVQLSKAPVLVVILQMLATVALVLVSSFRTIRFDRGWRTWAISVPPLFVLMMVTSMLALRYVTVGAFVVVRNLGPLVTLVIETTLHRPENLSFNVRTAIPLVAIALGVLLYEIHDINFSPLGMLFLIANLLLACAERLLQRHLLSVNSVQCSPPTLMLLNNGIGAFLALLVLPLMAPKEPHALWHALRYNHGTSGYIAATCVVGCAISYCGLWLQSLVTATSFMVLGSVTKLVVIAWGMLFFADASGVLAVLGAMLSVGGGFAYARVK